MKGSDLKVGYWNETLRLESLKILPHLLLFKFPRSSFRREAGAVCRNFCYNPSKNNVVKVWLSNRKKCLLFDFQQHTSYLFQCSPQTAPSPLYYTRWVLLRSTAQATHPGPVLTSPAFQVSAEIANCGQNGWAQNTQLTILWCGSSNYFGFSPVCANSDKCCRNGVRYIFLILSFICSILSFVGTRLLGEGWTLQQVQLKQFVL